MKKQKASKLLVSILALALVTSIGSTTVFASQSPTSQKTTQNTIWIDPSKGYDKNGRPLSSSSSDGESSIQPRAGTIYRVKNPTRLGSTLKLDRYFTPSWGKVPNYNLKSTYTYTFSTKVEGSGTIKSAVKLLLGADFTYSCTEEVGTEYEADKNRDNKLALFVEYDKYKGDAYRVDYEDDFGTVKETRIGTAKYEVPVDSYIRVVYK